MVKSESLSTRVLSCGSEDGIPAVFLHGNFSSATWWEDTMNRLPEGFRAHAFDLRGYGFADPAAKIDATRGMDDWSDDLLALLNTLNIGKAHLIGHSIGGAVLWRFLAEHAERVLSVTLCAPSPPHGFSGCLLNGSPCYPDGAGSGASVVSSEFVEMIRKKEKSETNPLAPLSVLKNYVWSPGILPARSDILLAASLSQHLGERDYPGDSVASENWPGRAPGRFGPLNALSPVYQREPLAFTRIPVKPPVLWIRGSADSVVSDHSMFELGTLGKLGVVSDWPGQEVFPPQPMICQIHEALDQYKTGGGCCEEAVLKCGHSPHLELPEEFDSFFHKFLGR